MPPAYSKCSAGFYVLLAVTGEDNDDPIPGQNDYQEAAVVALRRSRAEPQSSLAPGAMSRPNVSGTWPYRPELQSDCSGFLGSGPIDVSAAI